MPLRRFLPIVLALIALLPLAPTLARAQPDLDVPPPAPPPQAEPAPEAPPAPPPEPQPTPAEPPEPVPLAPATQPASLPVAQPARAAIAAAPAPLRFGLQAQTVLDTGLFFLLNRTTFSFNEDQTRLSEFMLAPSLGVFVQENLLIQIRVRYSRVSQEDASETTFGVGVGVGLNIPLGSSFSLLPGASVMRLNTDTDPSGTASPVSFQRLLATFSMHLLFHPAPHVYLGLGPSLSTSLRTKVNNLEGLSMTVVGADGLVGVWW